MGRKLNPQVFSGDGAGRVPYPGAYRGHLLRDIPCTGDEGTFAACAHLLAAEGTVLPREEAVLGQDGLRVTLIGPGGGVLADTDAAAAQMESHSNRPEGSRPSRRARAAPAPLVHRWGKTHSTMPCAPKTAACCAQPKTHTAFCWCLQRPCPRRW